MYNIFFYKDKNGTEPVADYLLELANKKDKDSRINLNKIRDYIKILSECGVQAKEPYVKHITGDIWELRPLRNRILFVAWIDGSYILLHHFIKDTRKTPTSEIEKAKREYKELLERNESNEQNRK